MDALKTISSQPPPPIGAEDLPDPPSADSQRSARTSRSSASKRFRLRARVTLEKAGQLPVEADLHEVSRTGMFVATASTFPAGTPLQFTLRPVQRTVDPLRGRLVVVWRRQLSAGPGRPAGVGCSFQSFEGQDEETLGRWLDANPTLELGRAAPDRSTLTRELSRFAAEMNAQDHDDSWNGVDIRTSGARHAPFPGWLAWSLAAIGLLAAALLASIWLMPGQPATFDELPASTEHAGPPGVLALPQADGADDPGANAPVPAEPATGQPMAERAAIEQDLAQRPPAELAAAEEPEPQKNEAAAEPLLGNREIQQIRLMVRQWAAAWSDQEAERYLGFYGSSFTPVSGADRAQWETRRRQRIAAPAFVRVTVRDLEVTDAGAADDSPLRAQVTFLQRYESPNYGDEVSKTLTVERAGDGAWKIVDERSVDLP